MQLEYWFCKRCGHCCKHQRIRLELYHDEISLFPKGSYLPHIGYGDTKSNIIVLMYKIISSRCPMYNEEIGCTIYENRPILCRRFPVTTDPKNLDTGLGLDSGCRNAPRGQHAKTMTEEKINELIPVLTKVRQETNTVLEKYKTTKLWLYKNFKWKHLDQNKLERMFIKSK